MSLLKQDTTRKRWVEILITLDKNDSKVYKVKVICDSLIYTKKSDIDHYQDFII